MNILRSIAALILLPAVQRELRAPGVVTNVGRPPFGAVNETVRDGYAAERMRIWLWTKDTNDWRSKTQQEVVDFVLANAGRGDTVLMHKTWNAFNPDALAAMKTGLGQRGLTICRNPGTATTADLPADLAC